MRNQREMSMRCARAKRYTIHGIDVLIEWESSRKSLETIANCIVGLKRMNKTDRKKHQQKNRA